MTDLSPAPSIPSRLGVVLTGTDADTLAARLTTSPATCHAGRLRASAVVFLADVVAGLSIDTDPDWWSFTSDLSLRLPDRPAPAAVDARPALLRAGQRSSTAAVELVADGRPFGHAVAGFARVPRRPDDPPKPTLDLEGWAEAWAAIPVLDVPLREAAGIVSHDAATGEVALDLRPELLNPAGALQGAMVSLVAECAAEDYASHHAGAPRAVTELDVRFLAQGRQGPFRARATPVDDHATDAVHVTLVDEGAGRTVAHVFARTVDASAEEGAPSR